MPTLPDASTATPAEFVNAIINYAVTVAAENVEEVSDAAQDLIREQIGYWWNPPTTVSGFTVTAEEPEVPEVDDQWYLYREELDRIIALLSDELANFFATYYPLASDAFDEANAKVIDIITNGGTGIPATIENQIWSRARERIVRDGLRVEDNITNAYAAKGFSLPQGAMLKKIDQVRFEQLNASGEQSTNIALKQAEIEIENIRFAIDWALKSRTMGMQAAADYIRAIASSPAAASDIVDRNNDAQAKMMAATADFYRARLSRDELVLKSSLTKVDHDLKQWKDLRDTVVDADQVKVQALAHAAEAYGKAAQAALMSLNTIASTATNAFS